VRARYVIFNFFFTSKFFIKPNYCDTWA